MTKWAPSCNPRYSRQLDEAVMTTKKVDPPKYLNRYDASSGAFKEKVKVTPDLLKRIARQNSYMAVEKLSESLALGERIYTSFSYYEKAQ